MLKYNIKKIILKIILVKNNQFAYHVSANIATISFPFSLHDKNHLSVL